MPPKADLTDEEIQEEEEEQEPPLKNDLLKAGLTGDVNDIKPTKWDDDFEKICSYLIDEAQINTFLHLKSHRNYSGWSSAFQIPIIVLSAVVGSANFASSNFGIYRDNIILAIGGISILIAIISSIAQYLKLAEYKESHRISSFHWEKFYNKLKVQLMLKREARRRLPDFYDDVLTEYQRLKEISPIFQKRIEKTAKKKEGYEHLNIPFYLNGFSPIIPYEKAIANYKYYFLTNNQERAVKTYIKNEKNPPKNTTPLDDKTTNATVTNSHYNPNQAMIDMGIIDSKLWAETSL